MEALGQILIICLLLVNSNLIQSSKTELNSQYEKLEPDFEAKISIITSDCSKYADKNFEVKMKNTTNYDYKYWVATYLECIFQFGEKEIIFNMNTLPGIIKAYFSSEETKSDMKTLTDVFAYSNKLLYIYKALSSFLDCMMKNDSLLKIESLNSCLNNFNKDFEILKISNITYVNYQYFMMLCELRKWVKNGEQNYFFTINSKTNYSYNSEKWTLLLKEFTENVLKDETDWYSLLKETYDNMDSMSEMEIFDSLQKLLNKLNSSYPRYLNLEAKENAYNTIKSNVIKMQTNSSCLSTPNGLKLQVTGKFLILSQILKKKHCQEDYKILEIFALKKIIIDQDIIAIGKKLQVHIFSPIWEVVGNRIINLDGASRNMTVQNRLEPKAKNGDQILNRHGAHGLAGLPGGPAGNFYGLANIIINGKNLLISLNGGNGSDGQDGGDGANGEDGESPSMTYLTEMVNFCYCRWQKSVNSNINLVPSTQIIEFVMPSLTPLTTLSLVRCSKRCYVIGLNGYQGGNGGNGGIKGKGHKAGDGKLFLLNDSVQIPIVFLALNGSDGKYGVGGKKGYSGYSRNLTILNTKLEKGIIEKDEPFERDPQQDGEDGKDNTSIMGSKVAEDVTDSQTFAHTVNLYKRYILSNFESSNSEYMNLYKQLINNKKIHKTYDTLAFVNEFIDLEQHYYKQKNKSETLILYESLRERVKDYYTNKKENEKTEKYEIILRSFDEKISHKIDKLEKVSNDNLVFMLVPYLEKCQKQFQNLQKAMEVVKIKEMNNNFTKEYDEKIAEAQCIIQENLQKEIDQRNAELNGETETLMKQIMKTTGQERVRMDQLTEKFELVKKKNVIKNFNAVFDVINTGLGFINPALASIGSKIASAGSRVLDFVENSVNMNIMDITPNAIDQSFEFFETLEKVKLDGQKLAIEWNLNEIKKGKEELKKKGENTAPLDTLTTSIKKLQVSVSNNKLPKKDLVSAMYDKLAQETEIWEKMNNVKKYMYEGALSVMKKIKIHSQLRQIIGDFSSKVAKVNDQSEIDAISKQIDQTFSNTLKLRNFKNEVFVDMIPIIEKIRETSDITGKASSSSIALLDFQKFEMEKYFKQVLSQLKGFIKEFGVQASFEETLENLEKAIDMMLITYGHIQEYVETRKKTRYDTNLRLIPFDITYIENSELSIALANMIQVSSANIVLDDYYKLKTSLMFYTFPFANDFIGTESTIPQVDNLLTRAEEAGHKFEIYSSHLLENMAELIHFQKTVFAKFGYGGLNSFHTWNNKIHSTEINDILMGNEVTLFANITAHKNLNAVKFSYIWLRFKSADSNISSDEINNDMENFSVRLLHNGDSYYRCDDRVFLIKSRSHLFENVYNDARYDLTNENEVIIGRKKRDYLLSPYATWKIQLVNFLDNDTSFEVLEKYKSKVHVELVGVGQYTERFLSVCKSNLTKYYENEL